MKAGRELKAGRRFVFFRGPYNCEETKGQQLLLVWNIFEVVLNVDSISTAAFL